MWRRLPSFTCPPPSTFLGLTLCTSTGTPPCLPHRPYRRLISTPRATSISDQVSDQLKQAMKAKDTSRVKALRGIRAAFQTALKEAGEETLGDELAVKQLRKLAKMRRESIEMFEKGGRQDLADGEQKELEVIEGWLPKLADAEQVTAWAQEAVDKVGAKGKGDVGKVMGLIMKDHKQGVDGKMVRDVVSKLLA